MTKHSYFTPTPELITEWTNKYYDCPITSALPDVETAIATLAAQWGADQELEACCEAIKNRMWFAQPTFRLAELRAARRPKTPRLKEQALSLIDDCTDSHGDDLDDDILGGYLDNNALSIIRTALEALPDD